MVDTDAIFIVVTGQAVGNLLIAALYSVLRLRKEERKVSATEATAAASRASFDAMTVYHARRLDLEQEKLELARRGAPLPIKPHQSCEGGRHAQGPGDYTCPECGEWSSS